MSTEEDEQIRELVELEQARCDAISAGDFDRLTAMLADDLTHTHVNGTTQTRDEMLAGLAGRPRVTSRHDDLRVRIYGHTAVMTGTLINTFPPAEDGGAPREMRAHALQVWDRGDQGWLLVAFAASGAPPT